MIDELSLLFPAPDWECVVDAIKGVQWAFAAADLVVAIAIAGAEMIDWRNSQAAFQEWREKHRSDADSCDLHLLLIVPDRESADKLQEAVSDRLICRKIILVRRLSPESPARSVTEVLAADYAPCRHVLEGPQSTLFRLAPSMEEALEHALDTMQSAKDFADALLDNPSFPEHKA